MIFSGCLSRISSICLLLSLSGSRSASNLVQCPTPPSSSSRFPSSGYGSCMISPDSPTLTSDELLPPRTGRLFISATLHPSLAALTAAQQPAMPPPTTTRSYSSGASAGEAGKGVEGEGVFSLLETHLPAILPMPFFILGTEYLS